MNTSDKKAIDSRVEKLVSEMTIEEKVGQMIQADARKDPEYWITEKFAGSFLHTVGEHTSELQKTAQEKTRLGIPLIFGIDAIHGHAFWPGAAVFPTQLALACSWNLDLIEEAGRITAKDVRATGIHWTFSPVLGTARDLRWGRVGETFGEDPFLIGEFGSALVRGYQGEEIGSPDRILACAKHFAGYSETRGGRDSSEADHTRRKLRTYFLPPFEKAVRAGCATIMTGYQAIDGVPCTANRWLLTETLKEEWGFEGFVVTDWANVERMRTFQKVCETDEEAAVIGVIAGNDMMMVTPLFPDAAVEAVNQGKLDEHYIDEACARILRMKFMLGLFDEYRYTDHTCAHTVIGTREDRDHAFECAVQSAVLLKNEDGILPLNNDISSIAVIGPNGDHAQSQIGDWAHLSGQGIKVDREYPSDQVITLVQGIQARAPEGCTVTYAQGCDTIDKDTAGIKEACKLAEKADIAVLALGDALPYIGETCDRADLSLSGAQEELCRAVYETGTPIIAVLINSKPLAIPWLAEHAHAIVEAFNPGMEGGNGLAAILFGDRNPCGKLTISFPQHVGQQPVYYNQVPGSARPLKIPQVRTPEFPTLEYS